MHTCQLINAPGQQVLFQKYKSLFLHHCTIFLDTPDIQETSVTYQAYTIDTDIVSQVTNLKLSVNDIGHESLWNGLLNTSPFSSFIERNAHLLLGRTLYLIIILVIFCTHDIL